jgi:4'-phosphopantetheinyl transferase
MSSVATGSSLGHEDVHVWLLEAPEEATAERVSRCAALLSAAERARMDRLHRPADRLRYLLAHALVRATLSRYSPDTPPAAWRFRATPHGRPELADGEDPLRFNLSHTEGLVACAVARRRDVGVDVEHLWPPRIDLDLAFAASHFAPAEVADLAALAPEADAFRERFFAIWTLKEAYIKARGLGLALPLAGFAFALAREAPELPSTPSPTISIDAALDDDPAAWHFARLAAGPKHALAVAARRAPGEHLTVRVLRAPSESP